MTEVHFCGTGEMSINSLALLGNSSASHTASWGQQEETRLLQCGCAHQTPECGGRKLLLFFTCLTCIVSLIAILSTVHLLCGMSLGAMEALVLSMC